VNAMSTMDPIKSVLQCVAVCCSVLQCVAVCCSVLQCVAVNAKSIKDTIKRNQTDNTLDDLIVGLFENSGVHNFVPLFC